MFLDEVDSGETDAYQRGLERARREILRGMDVEQNCEELCSQHSFLASTAKEANEYGKRIGTALATATTFLNQLSAWVGQHGNESLKRVVPSTATIEDWRLEVSIMVATFSSSPAPTSSEYVETVRRMRVAAGRDADVSVGVDRNNNINNNNNNDDGGVDDNVEDNHDGDDGQRAKTELCALLQTIVRVGRVFAKEEGVNRTVVLKACKVMNDFVSIENPVSAGTALEW